MLYHRGTCFFLCMFKVCIQTFPNNEVRQTLTKLRVPKLPELPPVSPDEEVVTVEEDWHSKASTDRTLDISSEFKTDLQTSVRKATKFGTNAKRQLLRCGAALESVCSSPSEVVFLTGTLPGSTPEALQAIADWAHVIVNNLKAWLSKYCNNRYDFYVWELQKRGALHLHYATHIPDERQQSKVIERFKNEWCNLLDMVGKLGNCDMYKRGFGDRRSHPRSAVQAYAQTVRKSVASYLAKYCGKDSNKPNVYAARYFPRRWWGTSRPLKALCASLTTEVSIYVSGLQKARTYIRRIADDLTPLSSLYYEYQHKVGVGMTTINYIMRSTWDMAQNILMKRTPQMLTAYGKKTLSKSSTMKLYSQLTDNFSRYSNSFRVCNDPSFKHYLERAKYAQSHWQDSEYGSVRSWRLDLLALSSRLTCNMLTKVWSEHSVMLREHPIQALWKLQALSYRTSEDGWGFVKLCDETLDKYWNEIQAGTSAAEIGANGVDTEELRQLPSVIEPVQLSIT